MKIPEYILKNAARDAKTSKIDIAIVFDRVSNIEESSLFSYCPTPAAPILFRSGWIVGIVNDKGTFAKCNPYLICPEFASIAGGCPDFD